MNLFLSNMSGWNWFLLELTLCVAYQVILQLSQTVKRGHTPNTSEGRAVAGIDPYIMSEVKV